MFPSESVAGAAVELTRTSARAMETIKSEPSEILLSLTSAFP